MRRNFFLWLGLSSASQKKYGGLNIRESKLWNVSVGRKLIWMIMEKRDLLGVKLVNGIYMKDEDNFWTTYLPLDNS